MARSLAALCSVALAIVLAGCGLSAGSTVPGQAGPGSIRPVPALRGVPITVGSKDFSDNINIAYIMIYALQAAGMDVQDLTKIQGSNSARTALRTGQIDLYPDYTGTAWLNYNQHDKPIVDSQAALAAVRADDAPQGISWITMAQANNTYAIGVGPAAAKRYGFTTVSDMAAFARSNPGQAGVCLGTEFASRTDGWPGMSKAYGIDLPPSGVHLMSDSAVYPSMSTGKPCLFGEVTTVDGRLRALDITVLADDKKFFPKYNVAACIRTDVLRAHPEIEQVLAPVMAKVTDDQMIQLNSEADVTGRDWSEIALGWLVRNGFVTDTGRG